MMGLRRETFFPGSWKTTQLRHVVFQATHLDYKGLSKMFPMRGFDSLKRIGPAVWTTEVGDR